MRVYVAGPEVFHPNAERIFREKTAILNSAGFEAMIPLDPDIPFSSTAIYDHCVELMNKSDAIIANLTPFRGPSADPGTVFELGYMSHRVNQKWVTGYIHDTRPYKDKVLDFDKFRDLGKPGSDSSGMIIEPFGLFDNLMVVRSPSFIARYDLPEAQIWTSMFGLKACVDYLKARV